jgi:hypothetical protein
VAVPNDERDTLTASPRPQTPEELVNGVISSFLTGFNGSTKEAPKAAPTVDNVAEYNRLLAKAEKVAPISTHEAGTLLAIADRHLRLVETALTSQK